MDVPAPILPPPPHEWAALPAAVRGEVAAAWGRWWEPFRDGLIASPPSPDGDDERLAVARFLRGVVPFVQRYGPVLAPLLDQRFVAILEELVTEESAQTPTLRRLGLAHIDRAMAVLAQAFQVMAALDASAPELDVPLPDDDESLADALPPALAAIFRLELYCFVAFDLVRAPSHQDFLAWARRAYAASQRALPFVSALPMLAGSPMEELSPDLALSPAAFARLQVLVEGAPRPTERLRRLLRRERA